MHWTNFLHIYQPPTQTEQIVRKVTEEGYRTLGRVLKASPKARVTLNISAVLTQQLDCYGLDDVISDLRKLAERGQIEFTGSAIYHPILPLIPKDEVIRQIKLNTEVNRSYFGDSYNPKGFFLPEMCYSVDIARTVK
jgi:4-alpha-glucanotransferase